MERKEFISVSFDTTRFLREHQEVMPSLMLSSENILLMPSCCFDQRSRKRTLELLVVIDNEFVPFKLYVSLLHETVNHSRDTFA